MKITIFLLLLTLISNCKAQIINGYTNKLSYKIGENVQFYLSGQPYQIYGNNSEFCFNCQLENSDFMALKDINGNTVLALPGFQNMSVQNASTVNPWENGYA
jgi:hypothetical protein